MGSPRLDDAGTHMSFTLRITLKERGYAAQDETRWQDDVYASSGHVALRIGFQNCRSRMDPTAGFVLRPCNAFCFDEGGGAAFCRPPSRLGKSVPSQPME